MRGGCLFRANTNWLCLGQEKRTMRESEAQIGNPVYNHTRSSLGNGLGKRGPRELN
jgi:hypothetical protein